MGDVKLQKVGRRRQVKDLMRKRDVIHEKTWLEYQARRFKRECIDINAAMKLQCKQQRWISGRKIVRQLRCYLYK